MPDRQEILKKNNCDYSIVLKKILPIENARPISGRVASGKLGWQEVLENFGFMKTFTEKAFRMHDKTRLKKLFTDLIRSLTNNEAPKPGQLLLFEFFARNLNFQFRCSLAQAIK